MDIKLKISPFKQLRNGSQSFNVFIEFPFGSFLLNGFRLMDGAILPPSVAYGAGKYFSAVLANGWLAGVIYDAVIAAGETLKEREAAIKPLLWWDDDIKRFLFSEQEKYERKQTFIL